MTIAVVAGWACSVMGALRQVVAGEAAVGATPHKKTPHTSVGSTADRFSMRISPGIGMFWYITQYKARSVPPPKLARRKVPNHYTGQLVETILHVPALTGWERTTIVGDSLGPGE